MEEYRPPKGLSKAWYDYMNKRRTSKEFLEALEVSKKKTYNPTVPHSIDLCLAQKDFRDRKD